MNNNTQLKTIASLPAVPFDTGKHKASVYDKQLKTFVTKELDDEQFEEWYNVAQFEEYIDEQIKTTPKGEQVVTYSVSPVYLSESLTARILPVTFAKRTYVYNKNTCLYTEDTGEMASWTGAQVREAVLGGKLPNTTKIDPIVRDVVGQSSRSNIMNIDTLPFNMYPGFPVNNCVLRFDNGDLSAVKYAPDMRFTRKCPWDYNPKADPTKAIGVLEEWMGADYEWLVQIPAQAVVQSLPDFDQFKQAYMMVGEHDSGRSTVNGMYQGFFGKENISTKTLQSFSERFAKADLIGKWMNFGDDLTTLKLDEGNEFKSLVGFSDLTVEPKYRDAFKTRITAVHAYSANALPELDNTLYSDEAWWTRWCILEFQNHFDKDPSWKARTLDQEYYEGFLLLVLDKACEIIKGRKLPLTQDWHEVKHKWIGSASKLHDFIDMSVDHEKGCVISKQCMLDSLEDWALHYMPHPAYLKDTDAIARWRADQRERLPDNLNMLTRALKREKIYVTQGSPRKNEAGELERPWVYKDVKFKDFIEWKKLPEYQGVGI